MGPPLLGRNAGDAEPEHPDARPPAGLIGLVLQRSLGGAPDQEAVRTGAQRMHGRAGEHGGLQRLRDEPPRGGGPVVGQVAGLEVPARAPLVLLQLDPVDPRAVIAGVRGRLRHLQPVDHRQVPAVPGQQQHPQRDRLHPGQEQPLPRVLGPLPAQHPRIAGEHPATLATHPGVVGRLTGPGQTVQRLTQQPCLTAASEPSRPPLGKVAGVVRDPQMRGTEHSPRRGDDRVELGLWEGHFLDRGLQNTAGERFPCRSGQPRIVQQQPPHGGDLAVAEPGVLSAEPPLLPHPRGQLVEVGNRSVQRGQVRGERLQG